MHFFTISSRTFFFSFQFSVKEPFSALPFHAPHPLSILSVLLPPSRGGNHPPRQPSKLGQNGQKPREPEAEGYQIKHIKRLPTPHRPLQPLAAPLQQVPRRLQGLLELLGDLGLRRDLAADRSPHLLEEADRRAQVGDLGVEVEGRGVPRDRDGDRFRISSSIARGGAAATRGEAVPAFSFGVGGRVWVRPVLRKRRTRRRRDAATTMFLFALSLSLVGDTLSISGREREDVRTVTASRRHRRPSEGEETEKKSSKVNERRAS